MLASPKSPKYFLQLPDYQYAIIKIKDFNCQFPKSGLPLANAYDELKQEIDKVREEMNDILTDQNDINESTRAQLDAISTALAELQSSRSQIATLKPRKPIGFIQPEENEEDDNEEKK